MSKEREIREIAQKAYNTKRLKAYCTKCKTLQEPIGRIGVPIFEMPCNSCGKFMELYVKLER